MTAVDNPYIDNKTGVFKNKLGIKDADRLHQIEYIAASNRARELRENPIHGNYDLSHMAAIHKHLMKDVYEWAGEKRTLNFSKKDAFDKEWTTKFSPVNELEERANKLSEELKAKNFLKNLDKESFVRELTNTYTKLNYLHPFPEGNGRTTQELLSQLAKGAGYEINYKGVGKIIWNHAAARSQEQTNLKTGETRPGDSTLMNQVFNQIVKPIDRKNEIPNQLQKKVTEKNDARVGKDLNHPSGER